MKSTEDLYSSHTHLSLIYDSSTVIGLAWPVLKERLYDKTSLVKSSIEEIKHKIVWKIRWGYRISIKDKVDV